MKRCEQVHEWIEQALETGENAPGDIAEHLRGCEACRQYQAALQHTMELLDTIQVPDAPPQMVDHVMAHIQQREQSRLYIPGWAALASMGRTVTRYIPDLRVPLVLQREAWPTAIATAFILFGTLAAPLQQPEGMEKFQNNPVVKEVNQYAARMRASGEHFIEHVDFLRKTWLGLDEETQRRGGAPFGPEMLQILK